MMKKKYSPLQWVGIAAFGVFYWVIFVAGIMGNSHAFNVFKFMAWVGTILSLFALLITAVNKATNKPNSFNRMYPAWFGVLQDSIMCFILAFYGHFLYATLIGLQQFFEYNALEEYTTAEPSQEQLETITGVKPSNHNVRL